jgi:hypothetical protein
MQLEHTKAMLAGAWILAASVVGLLAGVTSGGAWILLAGVALVPPLAILLFWHGPSETLSQTIQRGRR